MEFDDLLDRLYGFDFEVLKHDVLVVFINYRTRERTYFHNCPRNNISEWLEKTNPIIMGYNSQGYDKYILKGWLSGMSPEELKQLNDYIIDGGNGWEYDYGDEYIQLPYNWDLMGCIKTFKSLKELEGNLRMNITESKVDFNVDHKLTKEEFEDLLYYCTADVNALFPVFEMLINNYKSKFIIAKLGGIDPAYALSMTDANLTAKLLGGKKKTHNDNFAYVYPDVIDKSKIPKEVLDYIDDLVEHNDLNYKPKAPTLKIDDCVINLGVGGIHGAKETTFIYGENEVFECE